MKVLKPIFERNRLWAERVKQGDPEFFSRLSHQQAPEYLWIGCSDSRVPANQIVDMPPGEIFVHRNIANLVVPGDVNCLSVVQYAVEVLKVRHIIVCGHYGCGGIRAALEYRDNGLIDEWLQYIRNIHQLHRDEIDALTDEKDRINSLCRLNVVAQTRNLCDASPVREAWERGQSLAIHGWIYGIEDGILQDLNVCVTGPDDIRQA